MVVGRRATQAAANLPRTRSLQTSLHLMSTSPHMHTVDRDDSKCTLNSNIAGIGGSNATAEKRVRLNVGGRIYETFASTFAAFPDSLLGAMFNERNVHLLHPESGEYFFDRNGDAFAAVLDFYRSSGRNLHIPPTVSRRMVEAELEYFQVVDGVEARPFETHAAEEHSERARTRPRDCDSLRSTHSATAMSPKSGFMQRQFSQGAPSAGLIVDRCARTNDCKAYGETLRAVAMINAEANMGSPYFALLDEIFATAEQAAQMGCQVCVIDVIANCSYKRMCSSELDSKRSYTQTFTWCRNIVGEEDTRLLQSCHVRALIGSRLREAGLDMHDFQRFGRRGWSVRMNLWEEGHSAAAATTTQAKEPQMQSQAS